MTDFLDFLARYINLVFMILFHLDVLNYSEQIEANREKYRKGHLIIMSPFLEQKLDLSLL